MYLIYTLDINYKLDIPIRYKTKIIKLIFEFTFKGIGLFCIHRSNSNDSAKKHS